MQTKDNNKDRSRKKSALDPPLDGGPGPEPIPTPTDSPPPLSPIDDSGAELIRFVQNENGQHYILNSRLVRAAYEARYTKSTGGDFKFILPMEVSLHFPEMKRLSLESLDWEPIEPYAPPPRADTPGELHRHWDSAKPVPQTRPIHVSPVVDPTDPLEAALADHSHIHTLGKIKVIARAEAQSNSELRKSVLGYIQECYNDIKTFISKSVESISRTLDDQFRRESNGSSAFYYDSIMLDSDRGSEAGLQHRFERSWHSRREFVAAGVYAGWMAEVDKYVMDMYNEGTSEDMGGAFLRFRIDALAKVCAYSLATLLIRRLVGFCKVRTKDVTAA